MPDTAKKIVWDKVGERLYETGVDHGVLYPVQPDSSFDKGVAWNGLTNVSENPSGAEASPIYADNIKYANLIGTEEFGASIEAFTYPDEFAECDGSLELAPGVFAGQQRRKTFGLSYRTLIGNDTDLNDHGYKIHLVYNCMAAPSEKSYGTINESPDVEPLSWELTTTPVAVTTKIEGKTIRPTATLVLDSTKIGPENMAKVEKILYGDEGTAARLPLPDEILTLIAAPVMG